MTVTLQSQNRVRSNDQMPKLDSALNCQSLFGTLIVVHLTCLDPHIVSEPTIPTIPFFWIEFERNDSGIADNSPSIHRETIADPNVD